MLVDLPELVFSSPVSQILARTDLTPERLAQGVYKTHLNFNHDLRYSGLLKSENPFSPWWDLSGDADTAANRLRLYHESVDNDTPNDYGVCDSWEQITARWPQLENDERNFVISLAEIVREEQSPDGGWRWHKWGKYIGTFDHQYEYLYDEVGIDRVFCFSIYEVNV